LEDFFDFFAKSHERWLPPDKSDVEKRRGHDGWEREGLRGQIMLQGEVLPRHAQNFEGAFSRLWKQFDGCHGFVSKPA